MLKFIPSKQLCTRPSDLPWWTPECTIAVRAKQNAWLTKKTSPYLQNVAAARVAAKARRDVLDQSRFANLQLVRQRLSNGSLRDKQRWSTIKQAGSSGRNSSFSTWVALLGFSPLALPGPLTRYPIGAFFTRPPGTACRDASTVGWRAT